MNVPQTKPAADKDSNGQQRSWALGSGRAGFRSGVGSRLGLAPLGCVALCNLVLWNQEEERIGPHRLPFQSHIWRRSRRSCTRVQVLSVNGLSEGLKDLEKAGD